MIEFPWISAEFGEEGQIYGCRFPSLSEDIVLVRALGRQITDEGTYWRFEVVNCPSKRDYEEQCIVLLGGDPIKRITEMETLALAAR